MTLAHLFLPSLLAAATVYLLTPRVCLLARALGAMDLPSPRKIHQVPVPRLGGVAVVPSVLVIIGLIWFANLPGQPEIPSALYLGLTLGILPIFIVSLWDDLHAIGPLAKLGAQAAGAGIAVAAGLHLNDSVHIFGVTVPLGLLAIPLSMIWLIGITNAFNLVDGLDGLSAGLGLISATSLAIVAVMTVDPTVATLSLVVAGALAGFIPYNLHPAKLFLGDSGATCVGFTVACLTLYSSAKLSTSLAVVVPLFIVGVPVADTVLSILRRVVRGVRNGTGLKIFQADRDHIHHRLVTLGVDHRRAVLILYGAGVAMAAAGVVSLFVSANNAALLLTTLFAAGVIGVGRLGYEEFALLRGGSLLRMYEAKVVRSGHFKAIVDIALVMLAFYGAVALKFDDWNLAAHRRLLMNGFAILPPVCVATFWMFRIYNRSWRFASLDDVIGVNCAVAVSMVIGFVVTRLFVDPNASATIFFTCTVLLMLITSVGRASFRLLAHFRDANRTAGRRAAIYGAGLRGTAALREIRDNPNLDLHPVGFIDDDPSNDGRRIAGLKVIGDGSRLPEMIRMHRLQAVLLADDAIAPDRLEVIVQACNAATVNLYQFQLGVQSLSPREHPVQPIVRAV